MNEQQQHQQLPANILNGSEDYCFNAATSSHLHSHSHSLSHSPTSPSPTSSSSPSPSPPPPPPLLLCSTSITATTFDATVAPAVGGGGGGGIKNSSSTLATTLPMPPNAINTLNVSALALSNNGSGIGSNALELSGGGGSVGGLNLMAYNSSSEAAAYCMPTAMEFSGGNGGTLRSVKHSNRSSSPQKSSAVGSSSQHKVNSNSRSKSKGIGSFCDCFGRSVGSSGGNSKSGSKYQPPNTTTATTLWPVIFANLGIFALLLLFVLLGAFIFLAIETSDGNGGVGGGGGIGGAADASTWHVARHTHMHASIPQTQQHEERREHQILTASAITNTQSGTTAVHNQDNNNNVSNSTNSSRNVRSIKNSNSSSSSSNQQQQQNMSFASADESVAKRQMRDASTSSLAFGTQQQQQKHQEQQPRRQANSFDYASELQSKATGKRTTAAGQVGGNADATNEMDDDDETVDGGMLNDAADVDKVSDDDDSADHDVDGILIAADAAQQRAVENIWDITVSLNILYKENWTKLAALEIAKFQDQLVKRYVMDLTIATASINQQHQQQQQQQQQPHSFAKDVQQQQQQKRYWQLQQLQRQRQLLWQQQRQRQQQQQQQRGHGGDEYGLTGGGNFEWNFATAFLYSLTVITTVGYGTITPRTTCGRLMTMAYATLGIPLTLIYLSSVGALLARLLRSLCVRLLCCGCVCPPSHLYGVGGSGSIMRHHHHHHLQQQQQQLHHHQQQHQISSDRDRKCDLKLKQLHQHQQQQQQLLPYCYVRPPADHLLDAVAASAVVGTITGDTTSIGVLPTAAYEAQSSTAAAAAATDAHTQQYTAFSWSLALPVCICIVLLIAYIAFGTLCICLLEQWPLIDGMYFCFMSLTTIGFCDLLPGVSSRPPSNYHYPNQHYYHHQQQQQQHNQHSHHQYTQHLYNQYQQYAATMESTASTSSSSSVNAMLSSSTAPLLMHTATTTTAAASSSLLTAQIAVWFCAFYILSGLTLTSMCVNLLYEEILLRMRVVVKLQKVASREMPNAQAAAAAAKERGYYAAAAPPPP